MKPTKYWRYRASDGFTFLSDEEIRSWDGEPKYEVTKLIVDPDTYLDVPGVITWESLDDDAIDTGRVIKDKDGE